MPPKKAKSVEESMSVVQELVKETKTRTCL